MSIGSRVEMSVGTLCICYFGAAVEVAAEVVEVKVEGVVNGGVEIEVEVGYCIVFVCLV